MGLVVAIYFVGLALAWWASDRLDNPIVFVLWLLIGTPVAFAAAVALGAE